MESVGDKCGVIGYARSARQAVKEIGDGEFQKAGEAIEPAGRDAINGALVFRDLPIADAAGFAEPLPANGKFTAPLAKASADMDCLGR